MTAGYSNGAAGWQPTHGAPWDAVVQPVVELLQRMGFVVGGRYLLAVPARQSGILRSTLVTLLTVEGERYIVAERDDADWVLDARAAGRGILRRGRVDEHVALRELPVGERVAILRAFPRLAPGGVPAFTRRYGVRNESEAFARLAARCPVFRVDRRGG